MVYSHRLECSKAITEFSHVLQSQPDNYQARYLLGMSYLLEDNSQHAVQVLEPLASGEQDNPDFLFALGICYGKLKRGEESQKAFDQMLRVGSDTAHKHFLLGKAYLDLPQNQQARWGTGEGYLP